MHPTIRDIGYDVDPDDVPTVKDESAVVAIEEVADAIEIKLDPTD